MGENICKWCYRQQANIQNIQRAHTTQYQKNKPPNQKMSRRAKYTFLQRRYTDVQQACEKLLNIGPPAS